MKKINKLITDEVIRQYATASQDKAKIHFDAEFALRAGFKRPIVHGMYIMGLAQSLYITEHPTQWITTYDMIFHKPLLVDSIATFIFEACDDNIKVTVTEDTSGVIASGTFSVKAREQ